jgi:hypothetical protein
MATTLKHLFSIGLAASLLFASDQGYAESKAYQPVEWKTFIPVKGQPEPVPEQWLQDEEAKIAHGLVLPESVPKPVPFDFRKAWWRSWLPGTPKVAVQYFNHLCETEVGEWIFKTVDNVEGLYFARPQAKPTTDMLTDLHGPENPWIQRIFMLRGDKPHDQASWLIQPPHYNYRFVEQPRRQVAWQSHIRQPYIRLFGYTREKIKDPTYYGNSNVKQLWYYYKDKTPMQVAGIPEITARYGYTWRGLTRPRDREHGIAGGEILIYDLQTKEVLAVRRQFLIAGRNPRGAGKAMWEVAARCPQLRAYHDSGEFTQFAFDVLHPVEPSTTNVK